MRIQPALSTNGSAKTTRSNYYPEQPVAETLTNGFFTIDKRWTVKSWNKAAEKLLGVSEKDMLGTNLWEKFSEILPLEFYSVYQKAFNEDTIHFEEYWGEMGSWFDVITYHHDDILSVSFKSSNQPHSEYPENPTRRLALLTELYRFVTEITNDCLWEWNFQSGEMFWIDGGHKRVFGYQIENSLIPQSFWESRIHPEDREGVLSRLKNIITAGTDSIWEDRYRFKKANGEFAHVQDRAHIIYEEGKASRMIGATQDITKQVLLENTLKEERLAEQRQITAAVLAGQENERAEIGRELHDNLNQILAVAKLYVQMAGTKGENRDVYLQKSVGFIMNVITEIRRIAKTLVDPGMHGVGLIESIKSILTDLEEIDPIKIEFRGQGIDEKKIDEKLQMTIFRIIQEQLTNILKHSRATSAVIELEIAENQFVLSISDNGLGCDMSKRNQGVGIVNINSRVEVCHGSVTIVSSPGNGYELKVVLPLSPNL